MRQQPRRPVGLRLTHNQWVGSTPSSGRELPKPRRLRRRCAPTKSIIAGYGLFWAAAQREVIRKETTSYPKYLVSTAGFLRYIQIKIQRITILIKTTEYGTLVFILFNILPILTRSAKHYVCMNSFFRLPLFFLACLLLGLGGCVTQRTLPYLQGVQYSTKTPVATANVRPIYKLQPGDVLSIRVQSVQPVLSDIFNVPGPQTITSGDPGVLYLTGYSVDENGSVNLPTVGRVKVQGLSLDEAQVFLQQKVTAYVRDANVLVKILSFKVTVLGEVRLPGRYFIYNPQATILEALGMAGDLTEFGNRQNVKLVRQTPQGSEVVLVDLTDANLLKSPYFYLLPNDALYVEPLKARTARGNLTNLGVVFAGISAIVLLFSFLNLNK